MNKREEERHDALALARQRTERCYMPELPMVPFQEVMRRADDQTITPRGVGVNTDGRGVSVHQECPVPGPSEARPSSASSSQSPSLRRSPNACSLSDAIPGRADSTVLARLRNALLNGIAPPRTVRRRYHLSLCHLVKGGRSKGPCRTST